MAEREWDELPYTMMRLSAAGRFWDGNRVYWRDQNVQLGDIDLNLAKSQDDNDAPRYTAVFADDELHRDFTLYPSLEADELRWSAPGICDGAMLTTKQLAEKLLSRLVTFYTRGLWPSAPTSSTSPGPSS